MANDPVVSVIIPAYNVASYISEALESVFAQTYRDFETIVVNDGSTDNTESRIAPYLSRIIYLSKKNGGVHSARNAGLKAARGRYIAFLDGDDMWLPRYLETMLGLIESVPGISAVYPNAIFIGSPYFAGRLHQGVFPVSEPVTFERVLQRECFIFCSVLLRKGILAETGTFDEELRGQGAEDLDLWLRILQCGYRFTFTREPLVKYRWRHDSLSNSGVEMMRSVIDVYEKWVADKRTTPGQLRWIESYLPGLYAQLRLAQFKELMRARNYQDAEPLLELANEHYRSAKLKLLRSAMHLAPGLVRRWALK
ncbi:MAG: glycosyltransferase [Blastocatellia bacterium]|nr:glycosyltransferase [Blastocatellia bacterium]